MTALVGVLVAMLAVELAMVALGVLGGCVYLLSAQGEV